MKSENIVGKKYGRLTVVRYMGSWGEKRHYLCKCDCGEEVIVTAGSLKSGNTSSCGCYKRDVGKAKSQGFKGTRLYNIWVAMRQRCYNKNTKEYHNYGGRGITVCDEWRENPSSFFSWALKNGYSDDLSIDRIDTNGNYTPTNCRWATRKEQANNKRNTHYLFYKGEKLSMKQMAEKYGINYHMLRARVKMGWTAERAIETLREQHHLRGQPENHERMGGRT